MNKDYAIFKKECLRLQKEWGLGGWEIYFSNEPDKKTYATTFRDEVAHKVRINFSCSPESKDEWLNVKKTAKHEMIHVLIGRLAELASTRFTVSREIEEAEEEVVQFLLKIIR